MTDELATHIAGRGRGRVGDIAAAVDGQCGGKN